MMDKYASTILIELEREGTARFSELMKAIKNPRTLSKKLKELNSLGMVESKDGVYSLSGKGKQAAGFVKSWLELIEAPKAEIVNLDRIPHRAFADVLERYCKILLDRFKNRLLGVLVFGSVARGDWTKDSDIDLLVVVDGWEKPTWERTGELMGLMDGLRQTREFKKAVGQGFIPIIQHYPLSGLEAERSHRIYIDACVDGIVLYERDGFLTRVLGNFRRRMAKLGAHKVYLPKGYYWVLWKGRAGEVFEL